MGFGTRSAQTPDLKSWIKQPLMIGLITTLMLCTVALFSLLGFAERQAHTEAQRQAERLGNSVQVILTPLVLADDRVSMNYLANQLVSDPILSGIRLTDQHQLTLAIAGTPSAFVVTREFAPNGERLGELTLWVDPLPGMQALRSQLLLSGLAFLLSVAAGLAAYRLSRTLVRPAPETFSDTLRAQLKESDDAQLRDTPPETGATTESDAVIDLNESLHRSPEPVADQPTSAEASDEDPDALVSFNDLDPQVEDEIVRTNLESWLKDQTSSETRTDAPEQNNETERATPVPTLKSYVPPKAENDSEVDLIELLRPEPQPETMPRFVPSPIRPEEDADEDPETEEIEIVTPVVKPAPNAARKLPIITEEQLDIFSLEQELDLLLPATEAGYLVLIDTTSAHSAHLEAPEAQQIRRTYRTLANSVARIYHGEVNTVGEDIEIRFDHPDTEDNQGMNAICAALLFSILYRSYNQSRIKQMAPVLNLHIALVRGQIERFSQMLDEARFLTRSTQTNNLISHTALTETPELKAGVLDGADLRREDEDKILIVKLEKRHQTLLEKQARYLLAKLAERAAKPASTDDASAE